uniref:Aa_trans domain-containing protein n=1 Tax=Gongylonema pulchrum TaxID=637853 RepID=A0A183DKF6_9BILA
LGELFDHGCDAISQVFVTLNICYAMLIGEERYLVLLVVILSVTLFYCAHWSTYCTGQLKFAKSPSCGGNHSAVFDLRYEEKMFTGRSLCCLICMQPVNALNTGGLLSVALSVGVAGRHQRDGTGG